MSDKNKVSVKVSGKEYMLMGIEEPEYIQKIALYVDRMTKDVLLKNSSLSTSMAAVLTSINIADSLYKTLEEKQKLEIEWKDAKETLAEFEKQNKQLSDENTAIFDKNTRLQLELAKREAELNEVRNSLEKASTSNKRTGNR